MTADPLVQAIANGALPEPAREALADVVQVLLTQAEEAAEDGPSLPEERTNRDAIRWQTLLAALRVNQPHLCPRPRVEV